MRVTCRFCIKMGNKKKGNWTEKRVDIGLLVASAILLVVMLLRVHSPVDYVTNIVRKAYGNVSILENLGNGKFRFEDRDGTEFEIEYKGKDKAIESDYFSSVLETEQFKELVESYGLKIDKNKITGTEEDIDRFITEEKKAYTSESIVEKPVVFKIEADGHTEEEIQLP